MPQPPMESGFAKKQILLGLITIFAIYVSMSYMIQTIVVARPRMAAELNGMALYSWLISIPSLAAAFVTLLFSKFSDMYGRRIMMLISMTIFFIGTILSALSPTFPILIAANTLSRVGSGGVWPLCFAVLGDMFPPAERSRWVGLLNLPQGIFALFGPALGGWIVDNLSWRHLYWIAAPLILIGLLLVPAGIPSIKRKASKIDTRGAVLVAIASSATILGLSFAGTTYPWGSIHVIGLLGVALLFWILFFRAENSAEEPIMDPQVFRNRTFLTVAVSGLMSFFGLMGMMMYFPVFLQGVQGISLVKSGYILTPNAVLMAFIGVPTGFILARTKRYKWMYIASYGVLTAVMVGIIFFNSSTPVLCGSDGRDPGGLGIGRHPDGQYARSSVCCAQKAAGRGAGSDFLYYHNGNGDRSCCPWVGYEWQLCKNTSNDASGRTAQNCGRGDG